MDPISITASLVAILGVAGSAAKLSKTLYSIAKKAGPAGLAIKGFALDVTTFGSIVELAHKSLHEHCNVQRRLKQSLILQSIEDQNLLRQLVTQSESVIDHIKIVEPRLQSINGRFAIITRLKWHLMHTEMQDLNFRVGSARMNLHLVVSLVTLEAAMQQEPSAEARKRIKALERQVKRYSRMIRMLGDESGRYDIDEAHDVSQDVQDMLTSLGQRMTRNSRRSRTAHSSSFREKISVHRIQEYQTPSSLLNEETPLPGSHSQSIVSGLDSSVLPDATPTSHTPPTYVHVQNSSSSLSSGRSGPIPNAKNEGDFISVRPFSHVLELSSNGNTRSRTGHINGKYVTVIVNSDFNANIISQAQAIDLGLEIQPATEDNILIKFGNQQERGEPSVGTAVFEWSDGYTSTRRPFTVPCYICTHNIPRIILGRPFEERLSHYWPSRSRA